MGDREGQRDGDQDRRSHRDHNLGRGYNQDRETPPNRYRDDREQGYERVRVRERQRDRDQGRESYPDHNLGRGDNQDRVPPQNRYRDEQGYGYGGKYRNQNPRSRESINIDTD